MGVEKTANKECIERRELVEIFNSLTPALKQQLLTNAKIIQNTQDIVLREKSKKEKDNKQ